MTSRHIYQTLTKFQNLTFERYYPSPLEFSLHSYSSYQVSATLARRTAKEVAVEDQRRLFLFREELIVALREKNEVLILSSWISFIIEIGPLRF